MASRPLPARATGALLREAKPLRALFGEARRIDRLQHLLESQLQPAAREHCRVASWREGCLLLIVTDGHWATRLRYQQRRLLRQLQAIEEFAGLERIHFKVQPPPPARHQPPRTDAVVGLCGRQYSRNRRRYSRSAATRRAGAPGQPWQTRLNRRLAPLQSVAQAFAAGRRRKNARQPLRLPVLQLVKRFDQLMTYRLAERLAQLLIGLQRLAARQQRFSQREAALARQPQPLRSQVPFDQPLQRLALPPPAVPPACR
ncbi:hypothetical protein SSTU70S_01348 [Stutzerimonas stutzeri]